MFSLKIRYTLYGMILSASLITLITQASTVDGVFGEYFSNMVGVCLSSEEVVVGFDNNPTVTFFGKKVCKTLTSLLDTIGIDVTSGNVGIGTVAAPTAKLQVVGMVKSSPTTISDSSDTLTTRSYVDAGLIDMCNKIGGTWDVVFNKCNTVPPPLTYSWQMGSYGACSPSCGPGTQYAPYVCKDSSNVTVADSFCTGVKPAAGSQSCNNGPCAGNSCSTTLPTCNPTGCTLTYSPISVNQSWNKNAASCGYTCNANYSDATCSTYTPPATYSWSDGGYGACSQACGGGTMYKSYYCMLNGVLQPDLACINAGLPKPSASQACNTQSCPDCSAGGPAGWGAGCSASWTQTSAGVTATFNNTNPAYNGTYTATCVGGTTWINPSSTCTPKPICSGGPYFSWGPNCGSAYPSIYAGDSTWLTDSTSPGVGSFIASCDSNGNWFDPGFLNTCY